MLPLALRAHPSVDSLIDALPLSSTTEELVECARSLLPLSWHALNGTLEGVVDIARRQRCIRSALGAVKRLCNEEEAKFGSRSVSESILCDKLLFGASGLFLGTKGDEATQCAFDCSVAHLIMDALRSVSGDAADAGALAIREQCKGLIDNVAERIIDGDDETSAVSWRYQTVLSLCIEGLTKSTQSRLFRAIADRVNSGSIVRC